MQNINSAYSAYIDTLLKCILCAPVITRAGVGERPIFRWLKVVLYVLIKYYYPVCSHCFTAPTDVLQELEATEQSYAEAKLAHKPETAI